MYAAGPPFLRHADGLDWRWVIASGPPAEWQAGWVATGVGTSAYLAMIEVQCPEGDVDLEAVIAMTEWARVSCFGDREMVLEGTIITGFGGYQAGTKEPAWLASWGAGAVSAGDGHMFYHMNDQLPLSDPSGGIDGQRLRLTGHFDDPAAATCRISTGDPAIAEPDELAILYCRTKFVASSVELMDH